MNYIIEKLSIDNVEYYARVSALAWKQSYKGIVNDDFLELINTEVYFTRIDTNKYIINA